MALVEAFSGERGTGQGDVTSPTCWIAIFDILLTALRLDDEADILEQTLQRSGPTESHRTGDRAFADDMISEARSAAQLQSKADIVSSFCFIFGLQFSETKLRHFVFQAANREDNPPLIIRGIGWVPLEVKAETTGCLKSLGGLFATHGKGQPALDAMKTEAKGMCAEVGATAASATTKVSAILMTALAKVRFKAKQTSCSIAELRVIDKIFYKFYRDATKNKQGFPYSLMYLPKEYGGLGLQSLADLSSMDKLRMLLNGLHGVGDLRKAAWGHVWRAIRMSGNHSTTRYRCCVRPVKRRNYWLRSVSE